MTHRPLPFSVAILAGGESRRFGSNKALADFEGETLVGRAARRLGPLTNDLFLVANDPAPYAFLGLVVHPDDRPGHGPLSGLHAALLRARHEWTFLVACDMPHASPAVAEAMAGGLEEEP